MTEDPPPNPDQPVDPEHAPGLSSQNARVDADIDPAELDPDDVPDTAPDRQTEPTPKPNP